MVLFNWLPWLNVADPVTGHVQEFQATTINDALSTMNWCRNKINDADASGAQREDTGEISKNPLPVFFSVKASLPGTEMMSWVERCDA